MSSQSILEKIKLIPFPFQRRGLKEIKIYFAGHSIKKHETVEYLGCHRDSKLSKEAMP